MCDSLLSVRGRLGLGSAALLTCYVRHDIVVNLRVEARKAGALTRFEPGDGVTTVGVRSSLLPPHNLRSPIV